MVGCRLGGKESINVVSTPVDAKRDLACRDISRVVRPRVFAFATRARVMLNWTRLSRDSVPGEPLRYSSCIHAEKRRMKCSVSSESGLQAVKELISMKLGLQEQMARWEPE
jgi:hypothetical protein